MQPSKASVEPTPCRLCPCTSCELFFADKGRSFFRCPECGLIFLPPHYHMSQQQEVERYSLHDNSSADAEYVAHMESVAAQIGKIPLTAPSVLDFGSGSACVLAGILQRWGIECASYDPHYGIGNDALNRRYDIIVMCEVIEHFRDLRKELGLVASLLSSKGFVLIRTAFVTDKVTFTDWWYKNDRTHINFLSMKTMKRVAELLGRDIFYSDSTQIAILGPISRGT